jgi:hypothetical protein
MEAAEAHRFEDRIRRARDLAKVGGLTHDELWRRVRSHHPIGAQQFRQVLKGKRRPRGWHRLLRVIALALAEEDCRPISVAEKQRRYLEAILGTADAGRLYRHVSLSEYVATGSDWRSLSAALIDLDYRAIAGLTEDAEGSLEQWTRLHAELHDCGYLMLDARGHIAGYWLHAPLLSTAMRAAKAGTLSDAELEIERLSVLGPAGMVDLYLIAMVLHPARQGIVARNALIGSFMRHLEDLAELGIYVRDLCFCAYTSDSERIAEGLELRRGVPHARYRRLDPDGERRPAYMFEASTADIAHAPRIATHWPLLAKRYRSMLERLRSEEEGEMPGSDTAGPLRPRCVSVPPVL